MEQEYHLKWEIDLWAESPADAAREGRATQLDPEMEHCIFEVRDDNGYLCHYDGLRDEEVFVNIPAPEKPKVVIFVRGGLVQDVKASVPVDYLIIDADIQDEDEATMMRDWGDTEMYACGLLESETKAEPQQVEHYYNQIPAA